MFSGDFIGSLYSVSFWGFHLAAPTGIPSLILSYPFRNWGFRVFRVLSATF